MVAGAGMRTGRRAIILAGGGHGRHLLRVPGGKVLR